MSDMPWVRFFASDWLGGTRGMSAAETGVYITLVASMYERGEPIPEDHARLARLCGASNSAFKRILETLVSEGKIIRLENGLWNDRVEKERVYRSEKSEVGKSAAIARWEKNKQNQSADDANALPTQSEGNAIPEARSQTSEEEEKETPTALPPPTDLYAFQAHTIRLTSKHLDQWRKAYPHISLEAELWALDEWAGEQGSNWFFAVSSALAKKERTAVERINMRRVDREAATPIRVRADGRI